jgi:hypothetical protein
MQVSREFHPELIPRKGERTAWLLFAIALVFLAVSLWSADALTWLAIVLVVLLFFSAGSISLGNWVDRKTVLNLDADGIRFQNGLRKVFMGWDEIQAVNVIESAWGQRVQVRGPATHFTFRTLGEVWMQGELKGQMGFTEGESILKEILQNSALKVSETTEKVRYYSRS